MNADWTYDLPTGRQEYISTYIHRYFDKRLTSSRLQIRYYTSAIIKHTHVSTFRPLNVILNTTSTTCAVYANILSNYTVITYKNIVIN